MSSKLTINTKSQSDKRQSHNTDSVTFGYVTRNAFNNEISGDEVNTILSAKKTKLDALIVSAQEEPIDDNKTLASKIFNNLAVNNASITKLTSTFRADTSLFAKSQVSQTIIASKEKSLSSEEVITHQAPDSIGKKVLSASSLFENITHNKGGLSVQASINKTLFYSASCHLSSYSKTARFDTTYNIMKDNEKKITQGKLGYNKLLALATTPIFFGGDVNYRNLIHGDYAKNPNAHPSNPMKHFSLWGLIEAKPKTPNAVEISYASKKTSSNNFSLENANKKDSKRPGETKGGKLDRVFYRGDIEVLHQSVIDNTNKTSDHKAVIAVMKVKTNHKDTEKFEASKKYLMTMITGLKTIYINPNQQEALHNLESIIDYLTASENSKLTLGNLLKELEILRDNALIAEKYRMQELDASNFFTRGLSKINTFFNAPKLSDVFQTSVKVMKTIVENISQGIQIDLTGKITHAPKNIEKNSSVVSKEEINYRYSNSTIFTPTSIKEQTPRLSETGSDTQVPTNPASPTFFSNNQRSSANTPEVAESPPKTTNRRNTSMFFTPIQPTQTPHSPASTFSCQ